MDAVYLDAIAAQQKLIDLGFFTAETVPNIAKIEHGLTIVETYIDQYLCYHAPRRTYTERLHANYKGILTLGEFPVLNVMSVIFLRPDLVPENLKPENIYSYYMGNRIIETFYPGFYFEVVYEAGLDPLPPIMSNVAFDILRLLLGDGKTPFGISTMMTPTRDISSLSLPGGLSKGWQTGKLASDNKADEQFAGTEVGRILSLLARYKRNIQGVLY